ncbi:hypothetical protein [Chamaesiphon sp.]|uniref:hypothetical protein n=1 Tax=Chamaesiphon sp. TaxID=2814140 RepID=UPI0035947257
MSKLPFRILWCIGMVGAGFTIPQLAASARQHRAKPCIDSKPIAQRVALTLTADKKKIVNNQVTYQLIAGKASVKPGDIIRYTVIAKNNSRCPLRNLVLKQPIPRGTNYVKDSATASDGAQLLFSIDGGRTFAAKPTLGKEDAPATAYNYLRWKFAGRMKPNSQVKTTYELQVKSNVDRK